MCSDPVVQLNRWSIADLRRRARILHALSEAAGGIKYATAADLGLGAGELLRWESGGGDEAAWFFLPDGRALLLVFDHESQLNLYSDYDFAAQALLYQGVPEDLIGGFRALPDGDPFLTIEAGSESFPVASGIFWFDGVAWRPSDGLAKLVAERNLDLPNDSGFDHCTSWCGLSGEFTIEQLAADSEDLWGVGVAELEALFAANPPARHE